MMARLQDNCEDLLWNSYGVAVLIDPNGQVAGVAPAYDGSPPVDPELEACILKALKGLSFPCLAGYAVCPEYVIAE